MTQTNHTLDQASTPESIDDCDAFEVDIPSPGQIKLQRARKHIGFIAGSIVVLIFICSAIFAPFLVSYGPYDQNMADRLINPIWGKGGSWEHPLGTDAYGRDYLTRLLYGARVSMSIGFTAALIAGLVGTIVGMIGGYFGGKTDAVVMYFISCKLALPGLIVSMSLVSVFGSTIFVLICVLGFLFWDRYAVVLRAATMQIRDNDFVVAAEASGASKARIILTQIFPNVVNNVIVILTLEVALAILIEATLSFLGLGIQPPIPSWGILVAEGKDFMFYKPYLVTMPGLCIFFLTIAINMMGDGIRDITSPEGRN